MHDSPIIQPTSKAAKSFLPLSLSWKKQLPSENSNETSIMKVDDENSSIQSASNSTTTTSHSSSLTITPAKPQNSDAEIESSCSQFLLGASNVPRLNTPLTDAEKSAKRKKFRKLNKARQKNRIKEGENPPASATSGYVAHSLSSWLVENVLGDDITDSAKTETCSEQHVDPSQPVPGIVEIDLEKSKNIEVQRKKDIEVGDLSSTVDVTEHQIGLGSWLLDNVVKVDKTSPPNTEKKKRAHGNISPRQDLDKTIDLETPRKNDIEVVDLSSTVDIAEHHIGLGTGLLDNVLKVDETSPPKAKKRKRSRRKNRARQDLDTTIDIKTPRKKDVEVVDLSKTVDLTENQINLDSNSKEEADSVIVLDSDESSASQDPPIHKISLKFSKLINTIINEDFIPLDGDKKPSGETLTKKPSLLFKIEPPPARYNKKSKKMLSKFSNDQEEIVFLGTGTSTRVPTFPSYHVDNNANLPQGTICRPVPENFSIAGPSHLPKHVGNNQKNYPPPSTSQYTGTTLINGNKLLGKPVGQPPLISQSNIYGNNFHNPKGPTPQTGLRPISIDGSNVAMGHGKDGVFSSRGLEICCHYFTKKGHKVYCFVPQFRKADPLTRDRHILEELEKEGHLIFTPSRYLQGRTVVPYDDRYVVQTAAELGGVIVSRDNFRDLILENPNYKEAIHKRLLMYTWVGDMLMFPQDPMGRGGPNLDTFLRF